MQVRYTVDEELCSHEGMIATWIEVFISALALVLRYHCC